MGSQYLVMRHCDMFKGRPQGKYINKHNVKLSYSTMRNFKSQITASNKKKFKCKVACPEQECECTNH